VRGDQQEERIDFKEVHAPTAAANTTRLLLAEAAYRDMHVRQVDVKAAYLNAPIEEEVYQRPPHGIATLKGKVWRVHKAVYGLCQAANARNGKLSEELGKHGFTHCIQIPAFLSDASEQLLLASLCMFMTCSSGGEVSYVLFVKQISQSFTIKDLGVAYHFLGFLIHHNDLKTSIQRSFLTDLGTCIRTGSPRLSTKGTRSMCCPIPM
jgi:hypothetical protein